MKYNIRGENIEVTDSIREYVEKKIGKLNRYFDTTPTSDVHVNLSVYNEEQQIEVTIPMTDLLLRAEEQHTDLYAAIDLVVDKLERQIRKYKTKVNPSSVKKEHQNTYLLKWKKKQLLRKKKRMMLTEKLKLFVQKDLI